MSSDESVAGNNAEVESNSSESDTSVLDFVTKLRPYDFEPLASSENSVQNSDASDAEVETSLRVGNIEWCQCDKCKCMESELESLCCVEANEIQDDFVEGTHSRSSQTSC